MRNKIALPAIPREIVVFSAVALILAVELVVLLPLELVTLGKINAKVAKISKDLATVKNDWPKRETLAAESEALAAENKILTGKYISFEQESTLLSFIASLGKKYNVEIKALRPGKLREYPKNKLGKFNYFPIDIEARGGFHNLALFLQEAQRSQYFFDVPEISISSRDRTNEALIVICGLEKG